VAHYSKDLVIVFAILNFLFWHFAQKLVENLVKILLYCNFNAVYVTFYMYFIIGLCYIKDKMFINLHQYSHWTLRLRTLTMDDKKIFISVFREQLIFFCFICKSRKIQRKMRTYVVVTVLNYSLYMLNRSQNKQGGNLSLVAYICICHPVYIWLEEIRKHAAI